jgi:hypothetical protein
MKRFRPLCRFFSTNPARSPEVNLSVKTVCHSHACIYLVARSVSPVPEPGKLSSCRIPYKNGHRFIGPMDRSIFFITIGSLFGFEF